MRSLLVIISLWLGGFVQFAFASEAGIRATSKHYELFADAPVDAHAILTDLEILRGAVLSDLGLDPDVETDPLRLTITDDMETFGLITPSGLTAAAYLTSVIGDDIVIGRSDDPDHLLGDTLDPRWLRLVLRHETVHHLMDTHYPRKLPIWLGEGLAEYYSTFEVDASGQVTFGRALPEQQTPPASKPWLPMRTVIENMATYPDFRKEVPSAPYEAQQLYYGQTFALAHYIMDQPNGLARVHRFVDDWAEGDDSEDSFQRAFGIRYDPLESRVRQDIVQRGGQVRIGTATTDRALDIRTDALSESEERANRLRLLLTHGRATGRTAARIATIEAAEELNPSNDIDLARALMAWRWGDWTASHLEADRLLSRVEDAHPDATQALKIKVKAAYGQLGQNQMDDELWQEAEAAARAALFADPDDAEMHMFRVAVSRPETVDLPLEAKASLDWLLERNIHQRRPMTAMMMVPALLFEGRFNEADDVLDSAERWLGEPSDQAVINLYRNNVRDSRARAAMRRTPSP